MYTAAVTSADPGASKYRTGLTHLKDVDIIHEAYQESVKAVYSIFFQDFTNAPNPTDQGLAEEEFVAAVKRAKTVRDRALTVLP